VLGSVVRLLSPETAHAEVRMVAAGQSLQAALNAAQPGDHVVLAAGATFKGSFKLPAKPFGPAITVRSSAPLPARRLTASDAPLLPTLVSGSSTPALAIVGTANWRVDGIRFESNASGLGTIVQITDSSTIVLDRLLIIGGTAGQKRAVQGNGRHITLTRSHIANIWMTGQDSQAFCAWDGAGPYTITDNYLEAASENIMFGGADSQSADRMPSDILIERNFFTKRLEWKGQSKAVKNLFELKAARRVTVRHNVFERSWADGQTGFGIAFTVRNQNGKAPWSATTDVLFEHNIVRDVDRGISILGRDSNYPSAQTTGLTIRNNLLVAQYDAVQLGGEAGAITIDHNTFVNGASLLKMYRGTVWPNGEPAKRAGLYAASSLTVTNNLANHNDYGVFGDQAGLGIVALQGLTQQYHWTHNVLAGGPSTITYPAVTWRPTVAQHTAQFDVSYALALGSSYRSAGTDGLDLGAPLPLAGAGTGELLRPPAAPGGVTVY
jgi:pectate lyase